MIRCTAIRLTGNRYHEHISELKFLNVDSGLSGQCTRAAMVEWVEKGGKAFCQDASGRRAFLAVRISSKGTKYVQTHADGVWSDNLLALPAF